MFMGKVLEIFTSIPVWNRWAIALIVIVVLFTIRYVSALIKKPKKIKVIKPIHILISGIIISTCVMVFPIYYNNYGWHALQMSFHHALRLFVMDGNISSLLDDIPNTVTSFVRTSYAIVGGILYILAPAATASFLLLFLKNFRAYMRYWFSLSKEIHIFSELNEKSLALASSLYESSENGKPQIIFADIIDKSEEKHLDLVERAEEINSIFFRKDLASIKLTKKTHKIYLINDDENEKIRHANSIIEKLKDDERKHLYIFSDSEECDCFMDSFSKNKKKELKMRIERINDIRFLIYHYLDDKGIELFTNSQNGEINIAIVGLGKYGTEIVKALLWYCQFPGFKVNITVFDKDQNTAHRLKSMFPELEFDKNINANGDMKYYISIIPNVEFGTVNFKKAFLEENAVQKFNHIFVMLGDDSENISASKAIRYYLKQNNCQDAKISTVIYNTALREKVVYRYNGDKPEDKNNKSNLENLDIFAFGDLDSFYSSDTVINSNLVTAGWNIHKPWGPENTYYMDSYNFYSSLAKALHYHLREKIMSKNGNEYQYKNAFPLVFSENSDERNWTRFIIENTISVDKAKELCKQYENLLCTIPNGADIRNITISDWLDNNIVDKAIPSSYICNESLTLLSDILGIAVTAAEIDHVRWNAYMRTEGFAKGEKRTEYRTHNNLVPVDELTVADCIKDI